MVAFQVLQMTADEEFISYVLFRATLLCPSQGAVARNRLDCDKFSIVAAVLEKRQAAVSMQ